MELIVLGSCGTYNAAGRACSSYLIIDRNNSLLIDLGNGAFANLLKHYDPFELDALILTHAHADHIVDIFPLRYYLEILRVESREGVPPLPVYLTDKALERIMCFIGGDSKEKLKNIFDFGLLKEGEMSVAGFKIELLRVPHVDEAYAVKVEVGGAAMVFSSDSSYSPELLKFARGTGLLMVDATYQGPTGRELMHMSAAEAGKLAAGAGVKKLILTHLWPHLEEEVSLSEAAAEYNGDIMIAREDMKIEV